MCVLSRSVCLLLFIKDVVFALAHGKTYFTSRVYKVCCVIMQYHSFKYLFASDLPATGKTGRFTLIEKWRNNERLLAPNESPLKVIYIFLCFFIMRNAPLLGIFACDA